MNLKLWFFTKRQFIRGNNDNGCYGGTKISKEEYLELRKYAAARGIKITEFKKYSGDIVLIKEVLDDIYEIAKDFPLILNGRRSVEIKMDYYCNTNIFATTVNHVVYLNAKLFSDVQYLQKEYEEAMLDGKFVKNTNYRSIIRHEIGHVVANIYKFHPMNIAKYVLKEKRDVNVIEYSRDNLSLYSSECLDGQEIISECFSAYYSNVENEFAKLFVKRCLELKGDANHEEKLRACLLDD